MKSGAPKDKRVIHYAMNKAMSGKFNINSEVVLVFECDLGWNGAGGLEDALKYMDKFKLEKIAVLIEVEHLFAHFDHDVDAG